MSPSMSSVLDNWRMRIRCSFSNTILLQSEVMQGQAALIALQGQLADARLALLLAQDSDVLLGSTP